jgi:hypothetical protein
LPFKCLSLYIGTFGYSGSFFQILIYFWPFEILERRKTI